LTSEKRPSVNAFPTILFWTTGISRPYDTSWCYPQKVVSDVSIVYYLRIPAFHSVLSGIRVRNFKGRSWIERIVFRFYSFGERTSRISTKFKRTSSVGL
jgi:hypothetical protein